MIAAIVPILDQHGTRRRLAGAISGCKSCRFELLGYVFGGMVVPRLECYVRIGVNWQHNVSVSMIGLTLNNPLPYLIKPNSFHRASAVHGMHIAYMKKAIRSCSYSASLDAEKATQCSQGVAERNIVFAEAIVWNLE